MTTTAEKLGVAVDGTPLLGARTGVGAFTAGLLGALAGRDDVAVRAFGLTWRGRDELGAAVPPGVEVCRRPAPARPLRTAWLRADQPPIEWWTGPVDVVHGTNFVVPPARRAAAVVSVHDLTMVRFPELCTPDTLQYPALLERAVARGAHVHTDSAFVAGEVAEWLGLPGNRVHVSHLGVPPVPAGDPSTGRELVGADRYVLALGTVEPRKNLPLLVGAFDALAATAPDLRLAVAGPDGWGAAALTAAIAAARHRDRIVRLGWVPDQDRADLLHGAAVFAYPSVYEGFGLPPLEAMGAGVPVVASDAGSLPEVLGDAALLVPQGDTEALADALARALDDADLRAALVATGRRRVERYTWEACAEGVMAAYRAASADR